MLLTILQLRLGATEKQQVITSFCERMWNLSRSPTKYNTNDIRKDSRKRLDLFILTNFCDYQPEWSDDHLGKVSSRTYSRKKTQKILVQTDNHLRLLFRRKDD